MEGKKYRKHKKAQEAARQAAPRPIYAKGVRTDLVDGGAEKPKGKPPMDPRYPPARYIRPDDYPYGGPAIVIQASSPLIMQPKKANAQDSWPNWLPWVILSAVLITISLTIVLIIFYVFGEFTESSPVYKGYFG